MSARPMHSIFKKMRNNNCFSREPFVIGGGLFGVHRCQVVEINLKKVSTYFIVLRYGINFEQLLYPAKPFGLQFDFVLQFHPFSNSVSQDAIAFEESFRLSLHNTDISEVCYYEWIVVRALWRHRKACLYLFGTTHLFEKFKQAQILFPNDLLLIIAGYVDLDIPVPEMEAAPTGIMGIRQSELRSYHQTQNMLSKGVMI